MPNYVALLRGINSGQNPSMTMEKLRQVFTKLGLKNVSTVIASGNVLFDLPTGKKYDKAKLEEDIEAIIINELGFTSGAIVKTESEMAKLVANNPYQGKKFRPTFKAHISFLKKTPANDIEKRIAGEGYQIMAVGDDYIASIVDLAAIKTPQLMNILDKEFKKAVTTRTWSSVEKILKKMQA